MKFIITLDTEQMNKSWPHPIASIIKRIENALRVEFTPVVDIQVEEKTIFWSDEDAGQLEVKGPIRDYDLLGGTSSKYLFFQ
jgi:hypothetical protein